MADQVNAIADAKPKLPGLFCVHCRHLDCAVSNEETMQCIFCEDGELCPVARREIQAAAAMKAANVVKDQVVWAKPKSSPTNGERANAKRVSGDASSIVHAGSTPAARSKTNGRNSAMATARLCACGCGEPAGEKWKYKRGHKPKPGKPPGGIVERLETANKAKLKEVPARLKRANGNGHANGNGKGRGEVAPPPQRFCHSAPERSASRSIFAGAVAG